MKTAILLDFDGTLTATEGIDEMGRHAGLDLSEITRTAMAGKLDFKTALKKRIELLAGFREEWLEDVRKEIKLKEPAPDLLDWLRQQGFEVVVVSGGFLQLIRGLLPDYVKVHANELVFRNGQLEDVAILADKEQVAADYANRGYNVISVGDGANDIGMFRCSSFAIGLAGKPVIEKEVDILIRDLAELKQVLQKPTYVVAKDVKLPRLNGNVVLFDETNIRYKVRNADVLVVRSQKVTAELMELAPKLRLLIRQGIGTDNIDTAYAKKRNIKLHITPASTNSVAELTIAFMILAMRKIHIANQTMREKKWLKKQFEGTDCFGKTLGIIGLGRIGSRVASIATTLGMRVIYYDPYVDVSTYEKKTTLEGLLKTADVVTLHVPLTEETRGIINEKNAALLKKHATLINTSRAAAIEPAALRQLAKSIQFLCLDVHPVEPPLEDYEMLQFENVFLTPHIGGNTIDALNRSSEMIREILHQDGLECC